MLLINYESLLHSYDLYFIVIIYKLYVKYLLILKMCLTFYSVFDKIFVQIYKYVYLI